MATPPLPKRRLSRTDSCATLTIHLVHKIGQASMKGKEEQRSWNEAACEYLHEQQAHEVVQLSYC